MEEMIYFDNNATTQMPDEVVNAMIPFLKSDYGNPSSAHTFGRRSRAAVDKARSQVADLLGVSSAEIIFTSGGTESDNWAIKSAVAVDQNRKKIITTKVEHEAVRKTCEQLEQLGHDVVWIDVDSEGQIDLTQLADAVDERTALVSVMWANNETGVLFPVKEIAEIVKSRSAALVHVDAVNAVGKIPIDLSTTLIDMLSISAHKFHGPKGIGSLFVRNGVNLQPLRIGGSQENAKRAGTEAVHQIVGIGAAAKFVSDMEPMLVVKSLRDKLESVVFAAISETSINGSKDQRLPNTSNISFEKINGEMLLSMLDDNGVCVSTGSACNSDTQTSSPVLAAMNVPYARAMGSIRFSLSRFSTETEVDYVAELLPKLVSRLR